MTPEDAKRLKQAIEAGYGQPGYPPFALTVWEDRNRFRDYVFAIIDRMVEKDDK